MFTGGWNRYRMFFKMSLSKGATAASVTVIGSLIGLSVAKTLTEIFTNMANHGTPREAAVAVVLGVVFWLTVVVIFASVIAYGRYKNDQQQFRKEVGFIE
jgi:hypothetical protein